MTKPADSDQIAKARRFREQIRDNHVVRVVGTSLATRAEYDEPAIMAAFAASERQAVIEDCCRAVCQGCADEVPVQEKDSVTTANGDPFWHYIEQFDCWAICDAAAIRSME